MSVISLFSFTNEQVTQLLPKSFQLERDLQHLVEKNMEKFFGVTFLESEFSFPEGRIDSLGIDENNCPVIFEYKRNKNENVINQGLYYLDWLMNHKAEFKLLTIKKLGMKLADEIDWSVPCVICIASDFTKHDAHAVNQMQKNIKLIRYKMFGDEHILFEQINAPNVGSISDVNGTRESRRNRTDSSFAKTLSSTDREFQEIYYLVEDYILSLGDDVVKNQLKKCVAFKKIKNIICVVLRQKSVILYVKLNPDDLKEEEAKGLIRDVRNIGHWGTGDTEITIKTPEEFKRITYLLDKCYEEN